MTMGLAVAYVALDPGKRRMRCKVRLPDCMTGRCATLSPMLAD